jgi:hypothetical protein
MIRPQYYVLRSTFKDEVIDVEVLCAVSDEALGHCIIMIVPADSSQIVELFARAEFTRDLVPGEVWQMINETRVRMTPQQTNAKGWTP